MNIYYEMDFFSLNFLSMIKHFDTAKHCITMMEVEPTILFCSQSSVNISINVFMFQVIGLIFYYNFVANKYMI